MGQIQRLTRGQTKPYASLPRIDWSHPLAQGLQFYGYDLGGSAVLDLVRGVQSTPDTSPPNYTSGMSQYGQGILYPNGIANGGLSIPSTPIIRVVAPPFAWATGCVQTVASPNNSFNRIWGRTANDGSPAPFENWCFQANVSGSGSQVRAGWSVNSSTEGDSATWNSLVANQFTSLLAQFTTSTNVDFYAQGAKQNSTTTSYSSTNTNDNIRYGSPGPATGLGQSFPGFVYYGAFWNRKLLPAEVLLLHQDPYCFLIYPEDDFLIVGVAASGSVATSSGSGAASGVGTSTAASTATSNGTGTASGIGASTATSTSSSSGTGTVTGVGASTAASTASASGVGTASATGQSTATSVASSAGIGTATGVTASTAASVGSSSGTGVATGVGSSTGGGSAGTSVGQGTASGVGGSTATATASATGTSSVSGVGASLSVSVGTSSGSSTATAVGFGSGSATGISTGQGSASGVGSSLAQAIASASGIGIATGVGNSSSTSAIGTSAGLATVLGISATIVSAIGTASGNSTVTGISELLLGGKTWYWKKGYDDYVKVNPPQTFHDDKIKKAAAHMSSLGGHARAKSLTSTQRTFIATKAAKARWK